MYTIDLPKYRRSLELYTSNVPMYELLMTGLFCNIRIKGSNFQIIQIHCTTVTYIMHHFLQLHSNYRLIYDILLSQALLSTWKNHNALIPFETVMFNKIFTLVTRFGQDFLTITRDRLQSISLASALVPVAETSFKMVSCFVKNGAWNFV